VLPAITGFPCCVGARALCSTGRHLDGDPAYAVIGLRSPWLCVEMNLQTATPLILAAIVNSNSAFVLAVS